METNVIDSSIVEVAVDSSVVDSSVENSVIEEPPTIEDMLQKQRDYWFTWIDACTKALKDMDKLPDLQCEVFSRRQEALEQYHAFSTKLAKRTKAYKEGYAKLYNEIRPTKLSPGSTSMMYTTEKAIDSQIEARLSEERYNISLIESYMNYMDSTIKTIDGIIYSIANRIRIEEIKIGK